MRKAIGKTLYTIKQSTVSRSDTSHKHAELQSPNRRAFRRKTLILFICWLYRKPPQSDEAYKILLILKTTNITCNLLSGIPWLRSSLIRYNLCEQIHNTNVTCSSKFKLPENIMPRSLAILTCSILSTTKGIWDLLGCGLWKNSSLVLDILITILLTMAQSLICSNSSERVQFEVSGTKRLVSSAYYINLLSLDLECKSLSMMIYRDGPIPEPCTIDKLIPMAFDKVSWTLHLWTRPLNINLYYLTRRPSVIDDSIFQWRFSRTFYLAACSVKTTTLPHTPNDLFDQIWRKGVPFGSLVQTFSTLTLQPPEIKNFPL